MRLKEPLYGIRVAQLHWAMHLSMAIAMIFIESNFQKADYTNDYRYHGQLKQVCYAQEHTAQG